MLTQKNRSRRRAPSPRKVHRCIAFRSSCRLESGHKGSNTQGTANPWRSRVFSSARSQNPSSLLRSCFHKGEPESRGLKTYGLITIRPIMNAQNLIVSQTPGDEAMNTGPAGVLKKPWKSQISCYRSISTINIIWADMISMNPCLRMTVHSGDRSGARFDETIIKGVVLTQSQSHGSLARPWSRGLWTFRWHWFPWRLNAYNTECESTLPNLLS